jgi:hypothetical protein
MAVSLRRSSGRGGGSARWTRQDYDIDCTGLGDASRDQVVGLGPRLRVVGALGAEQGYVVGELCQLPAYLLQQPQRTLDLAPGRLDRGGLH